MAKKLIVEIIGDATKLTRSFNQSTVAANKFGAEISGSAGRAEKGLTKLQKVAAGGFLGGAAASAGIVQLRAAIGVASNLEEQLSRNNVVFGESADAVADWSKSTATSMGIARDEALAAVGTFGAMFSQAGESAKDAAVLSEAVVQLGSDLASFNNTTVDESLTALRSGLSGEIEPLRRFQVFLTEAAVSQRAMADSNKSTVQQLTQGEKIMARWNLILEQTGKQQGDFARTSDGLANTQRRLSAQTRDLQANLGGLLLPAVTEVTGALADATGGALALADALRALGKIEIPVIDIPLNFTIPGTDTSAAGFWAKRLSPAGIVFNTADLIQFVGGIGGGDEGTTNASSVRAAKQFERNFDGFLEGLDKGKKNVEDKVKKFGEEGWKPLPSSARERADKATESMLESLGLKLRKAGITEALADDNAALLEIQVELRKAIQRGSLIEGLQEQLIDTQVQIAQNRRSIAADREADKADRDQDRRDKKRRDAAKRAADRAKETARILREAKQEAAREQARQFRAIGLTGAGELRLPGIGNLRKQFEQLSDNVIGQNVPKKLLNRLALVGKALHGGIKKLNDPTIRAIQDLFGEIRDTFDKEAQKGPITKTTTLQAGKILKGMGLSPEEIRELRARLSSFNSAGVALAGGNRPTGGFQSQARFVVENNNTITMDGEVVARNTTKSQQKRKRRNPTQKRGPNGGV